MMMMMMKHCFLTFGGPSIQYHQAVQRICGEARTLGIFHSIRGVTDIYLKQWPEFWSKHGGFIERHSKGYGYWLWKPFLIKKQLESMEPNDILVYADAGCTLSATGKQRLNEYFSLVNTNPYGNVSFQMSHCEKTWTKMDIIHYLGAGEEEAGTGQLIGTTFILRKCDHVMMMVNKWCDACCYNNYQLLTDRASIIPNDNSFRENRHDQSIWSVLRKKHGTLILSDETYPPGNPAIPIWASRIRGGVGGAVKLY